MMPAETQPQQGFAHRGRVARVQSTADIGSREPRSKPPFWREGLARYEQANRPRALLDLATSALIC